MGQTTVAHIWHLCQEGARKAWLTSSSDSDGAHLAPVPTPDHSPFISDQLTAALKATRVSQRELARRLAEADGTKPESKRRWLLKLLADDVDAPDMSEIEVALNLPTGHFVVPTPEQTRERRVRLEELEDEVARLRDDFDRFLRAASERRADIEEDQEIPKQPEARRSSRDSES